jgi:cytochrome c
MKFFTNLKIILFIGILLSLCVITVFSDDTISRTEGTDENGTVNVGSADDPVSEMVTFVHEATDYAKKNGKEAACREFSDRNGSFFRGSQYIYAYDFNGITLAHPLQKDLIGKSRLMEKDPAGDLFIRNLRDAAVNGTGFVVFHYINPAHNNTPEKKLGFVEKVDDTWWLGSGIYGENVTLPEEV